MACEGRASHGGVSCRVGYLDLQHHRVPAAPDKPHAMVTSEAPWETKFTGSIEASFDFSGQSSSKNTRTLGPRCKRHSSLPDGQLRDRVSPRK